MRAPSNLPGPPTCSSRRRLLASSPQPLRCAGASTKLRSSIVGWNFDGRGVLAAFTHPARPCDHAARKRAHTTSSRAQNKTTQGPHTHGEVMLHIKLARGARRHPSIPYPQSLLGEAKAFAYTQSTKNRRAHVDRPRTQVRRSCRCWQA
jgi:hypothetical protein